MPKDVSSKGSHPDPQKDDYPIGEFVKVHVWGERPWVTVVEVLSPTRMMAKIENHLICTSTHGLDYGDVAEFELKDVGRDYISWEHVVAAKGKIIKFPKVEKNNQGAH